MARLSDKGTLQGLFGDTEPSIVMSDGFDLDAYQRTSDYLKSVTIEGDKRAIQYQMGMGSVEELSGGHRGMNGAAAAKLLLEKAKKQQERDRANTQFQNLIDQIRDLDAQIGELQGKIAELDVRIEVLENLMSGLSDGSMSVEDVLSHPEAQEAVRAWERQTGKKFDKDAEKASDILTAILGIQTGNFIDQRNALQIRLDAIIDERNKIARKVPEIDELSKTDTDAAQAKTRQEVAAKLNAAYTFQRESNVSEIKQVAVDEDKSIRTATMVASNTDMSDMAALSGLDKWNETGITGNYNQKAELDDKLTDETLLEDKIELAVKLDGLDFG